jgi:hypothetical protein
MMEDQLHRCAFLSSKSLHVIVLGFLLRIMGETNVFEL